MKAPKLLFIRFGAMGDLVHASPSIRVLRQYCPEVSVHWLSAPGYQGFIEQFEGVDRVWTWHKAQGLSGLWSLRQQLTLEHYNGIINWHPSTKSLLLAWSLGQTWVYQKQKFRIKATDLRQTPRRHAVQDFFVPVQQWLYDVKRLSIQLPSVDELSPTLTNLSTT